MRTYSVWNSEYPQDGSVEILADSPADAISKAAVIFDVEDEEDFSASEVNVGPVLFTDKQNDDD